MPASSRPPLTSSDTPARRVLVFDSGIGGLGIQRCLRSALPSGTRIDYLADTALFPYGEQPDAPLIDRIVTLIDDAVRGLRPEIVVIACNTASTLALDALRARIPVPFVGCVPPIRWAARLSRTRTLGLLATRATVRRPYVTMLRETYAPDCALIAHGAPGLAGLAEQAFRGLPVDQAAIADEVAPLFRQDGGNAIDVVGIGCTHYTFVLDQIRAASPPGVTWLDPAGAVARQAALCLASLPETPQPDVRRDEAYFTALPADGDRLIGALDVFGYAAIRQFDDVHPPAVSARG
ncbi:glutamate racemase [Ameyamaea chiangmaiensis NBRC 103196]|uniref:Glutamate racemase n=1 Tax=Ameyamaea chiangmaiensis TaxID=442969 RepID=A0A850P5E1_9PROT|nr:aspartate/glutamate racemase family protein [Ameyamaea chiangmaiensis]MBS4075366.1 aspartate/glutamate racemase family protein [Ameyamaea chiangmaiensis]NVN39855.1 aspartate/glutamate racemase family protein [Ameyamaea chiangmaiensis]GBQ70021.1 glutamate racemase [Ameyamaea chiangmaiensis NBRC 103196]